MEVAPMVPVMLEAYAFLAMFAIQILAVSVLIPARLIGYIREKTTGDPTASLSRVDQNVESSLTLYRAQNRGIAVLGLLLLGWLFSDMQRVGWIDGPVDPTIGVYLIVVCFTVQSLPFLPLYNKVLKRLPMEGKRKAMLQRRGLFDFVSPFIILLAVLSYCLFAAFVIAFQRDPLPRFVHTGGVLIIVTLAYAGHAFWVYRVLYGRKATALETHSDHIRAMGRRIKIVIYSCIAAVMFVSLQHVLWLLDLQIWKPFASSAHLVICGFLTFISLMAPPPSQLEADGVGSSSVS